MWIVSSKILFAKSPTISHMCVDSKNKSSRCSVQSAAPLKKFKHYSDLNWTHKKFGAVYRCVLVPLKILKKWRFYFEK